MSSSSGQSPADGGARGRAGIGAPTGPGSGTGTEHLRELDGQAIPADDRHRPARHSRLDRIQPTEADRDVVAPRWRSAGRRALSTGPVPTVHRPPATRSHHWAPPLAGELVLYENLGRAGDLGQEPRRQFVDDRLRCRVAHRDCPASASRAADACKARAASSSASASSGKGAARSAGVIPGRSASATSAAHRSPEAAVRLRRLGQSGRREQRGHLARTWAYRRRQGTARRAPAAQATYHRSQRGGQSFRFGEQRRPAPLVSGIGEQPGPICGCPVPRSCRRSCSGRAAAGTAPSGRCSRPGRYGYRDSRPAGRSGTNRRTSWRWSSAPR